MSYRHFASCETTHQPFPMPAISRHLEPTPCWLSSQRDLSPVGTMRVDSASTPIWPSSGSMSSRKRSRYPSGRHPSSDVSPRACWRRCAISDGWKAQRSRRTRRSLARASPMAALPTSPTDCTRVGSRAAAPSPRRSGSRWLLDAPRIDQHMHRLAAQGLLYYARAGSSLRIDWRAESLVEVARAAA